MVLNVINFFVVFLSGIIVTASFLGLYKEKKLIIWLVVLSVFLLLMQVAIYMVFGIAFLVKLYPIIVHFPLLLFSVFICKKKPLPSLCAILLAYIVCIIRNCLGFVFSKLVPGNNNAKMIFLILETPVLLLVICIFIAPFIRRIFEFPKKELNLIIVPSVFVYTFVYITTVYTSLLNKMDIETLEVIISGFGIAMYFYIILALIKMDESNKLEQLNKITKIKHNETKKMIDDMQLSQNEMAVMRHDFRHYIGIISALAKEGNNDRILKYTESIQETINTTVVEKYCNNESVNLILVNYAKQAEKFNTKIDITAKVDDITDEKELDFCVVLSNALENAVNATKDIPNSFISVNICISASRIILLVKNNFNYSKNFKLATPSFDNDKHGIGTYSIKTTAEKYGGVVEFSAEKNVFVLQLVM